MVFKEELKELNRGTMNYRNRELVTVSDTRSLVRQKTLRGHWTLFGRTVFRTLGCLWKSGAAGKE